MNQFLTTAINIILSMNFRYGLLVGMLIGFLFWMYGAVLRGRNLILSADMETPTKLGRYFYYIVPEKKYNELTRGHYQTPYAKIQED